MSSLGDNCRDLSPAQSEGKLVLRARRGHLSPYPQPLLLRRKIFINIKEIRD